MRTGEASRHGVQDLFDNLETIGGGAVYRLERSGFTMLSTRILQHHTGAVGEWELMRLAAGLFVISTNVAYDHPMSCPVPGEDLIELHFRLSGRLCLVRADAAGDSVDVDQGTLLVWRQPTDVDVVERLDSPGRESSVTIYLRPQVMADLFGSHLATLQPHIREGFGARSGGLFAHCLPLYPRLTKVVRQLAASHLVGPSRLIEAEGLVRLILCEVLAMLEAAYRTDGAAAGLSDANVRCLGAAREMIVRQHTPPPTIDEIARRVGMGATKLKRGFRQLYGTSLSRFANDLRMQQALDLLLKSDQSILHVAETLGYEYQNSFTVAFRRQFNVLPKDYRRDPLILRAVGRTAQ